MDISKIENICRILFSGLGTSLLIFIITLVLSIPLGIVVALLKKSTNKLVSSLTTLYILVIRGTPMVLQIIFVYFAPYYILKISLDRFLAIIIAFVLNYAAYFSEIFRSGINSISIGQIEASYTLGLNKIQTFIYIILPQVIKAILPASSNEVVSLIKTTSLAQIIGVSEMFSLAQKQSNYNFSVVPLVIAGGYYLVIVGVISFIFKKVEKKLQYYN